MSPARPPKAPRSLISRSREEYGDAFAAHLLEQYKLYVDQASKISERRATANTLLLTVNSFIVTAYGLATALGERAEIWRFSVPVAGMVICLAWFGLVRSYRDLSSVKYEVIHELEQHLPAALYAHEWDVAEHGQGNGYIPFTHLELWIPWVFCALYGLLVLFTFK